MQAERWAALRESLSQAHTRNPWKGCIAQLHQWYKNEPGSLPLAIDYVDKHLQSWSSSIRCAHVAFSASELSHAHASSEVPSALILRLSPDSFHEDGSLALSLPPYWRLVAHVHVMGLYLGVPRTNLRPGDVEQDAIQERIRYRRRLRSLNKWIVKWLREGHVFEGVCGLTLGNLSLEQVLSVLEGPQFSQLEELSLSYIRFDESDLEELCHAPAVMQLRVLDIGQMSLGNSGLRKIIQYAQFERLEALKIDGHMATQEGLVRLVLAPSIPPLARVSLLSALNVEALRACAKELGVSGVSRTRREPLIQQLKEELMGR